jgi:N-acetylmuramoyl-L-alanine amidase
MNPSPYAEFLWKLCVWRESRGEPHAAKVGVAYCILNRASHPSWWGRDIVSVILKPWQFSSFNVSDLNSVKFPLETDTSWTDSCQAVDEVAGGCVDPTGGGVYYHDTSISPPSWATDGSVVRSAQLGALIFYARA